MSITFTVRAATFAYDGNPKPVTVTAKDASGALFTDFTVLYDGSEDAPYDAGIYTVTVLLDDETNYTVSSWPETTLTITAVSQDQLTIVGLLGSVVYGDSFTLTALGGTGNGAIAWASDNAAVTVTNDDSGSAKAVSVTSSVDGATYEVTYNGSAAAPTSAGTYTIYATFSGENYESLTVQDTFTIAKAKLTATAENKTRAYGEANPV